MDVAAAAAPDCADTELVLVPVGATEQHGPHLPLGTDTTIAVAVAARTGRPVTPPIAFAASGEHEGFPGTISVGVETLAAVLVETGRSAGRWAGRLAFVNAHGGNVPALSTAVTLLRSEGRDVGWFACGVPGADAHAGRHETSVMLALAPESVGPQRPVGATAPLRDLMPAIRAGSVADVSPSGVLGDATDASGGEGAESLAMMVGMLRAALERWRVDEYGRLG